MFNASKGRSLLTSCLCCPTQSGFAATSLDRRAFVTGGAALGLAAFAAPAMLRGAFAQSAPHRIDVHHHISPPTWLDAMKSAKKDNPPMTNWSVQKSLDDMDKAGVATAITSPTTPQVGFMNAADAARLSRESNDYAKKLMADHPNRFGIFAMLPLPHIDESLKEIAYALDTLKADGVGIMTSYGDKWLGYAYFHPVLEELNRRKATVYTHPTAANCCGNLVQGIQDSAIEFGTDTTRTMANLIFSGTSAKYPDINWIFSHGGGALTAFAERFLIQLPNVPPYRGKVTRESVDAELRRYYYDTAQIANAVTLSMLPKIVPMSQIVFGGDFPYRTSEEHTRGITATFSGADLRAVDRENALRILPRLRTA